MKNKTFLSLLFLLFVMHCSFAQETLKLRIEKMDCPGCAGRVKSALSDKKGICDIAANLEIRAIEVSYDTENISTDEIKQMIAATGFESFAYDPDELIEREISFRIFEMNNEKCLTKVKNEIALMNHTLMVDGDLNSESVSITYDANKISSEDIKKGLEKNNYLVLQYYKSNEFIRYVFYKVNKKDMSVFQDLSNKWGVIEVAVNSKNKLLALSHNINVIDQSKLEAFFIENNYKVKVVN